MKYTKNLAAALLLLGSITVAHGHGFPFTPPTAEASYLDSCEMNSEYFELTKTAEAAGSSCTARQVLTYFDMHAIYDGTLIDPNKEQVCAASKRIARCGYVVEGCANVEYFAVYEKVLEMVPAGHCDTAPADVDDPETVEPDPTYQHTPMAGADATVLAALLGADATVLAALLGAGWVQIDDYYIQRPDGQIVVIETAIENEAVNLEAHLSRHKALLEAGLLDNNGR